jgi:hypothetical protein
MTPAFPRILLVASLAACSSSAKAPPVAGDEAQRLLLDRNWLDKMPETQHDKLHVYRFVPSMGGGVFQDRTLYKGTFELFRFEATGEQIRFDLPETDEKITTSYRIDVVDEPPFDLRLTVSDDPRGPHVYYGMRGETDRDGTQLQQRLQSLPR